MRAWTVTIQAIAANSTERMALNAETVNWKVNLILIFTIDKRKFKYLKQIF